MTRHEKYDHQMVPKMGEAVPYLHHQLNHELIIERVTQMMELKKTPLVVGCISCGFRTTNATEVEEFRANGCKCQWMTKEAK